MRIDAGRFTVRLAEDEDDVRAAQRLRYRVFVEEMGATPSPADATERRETDRFDPYFEHMLLIDNESDRSEIERGVVGVYRLMRDCTARQGIGFYGQSEYDLEPLLSSERASLELGRSCVDRQVRGGAGMHMLWNGLGEYVNSRGIQVLFGVASFHGNEIEPIAQALSYLHYNHLAPEDLRVRAIESHYAPMDILSPDQVCKTAAMRQLPALIKAYIRLGGFVGEGAFIDRDFNTIDVCLLMDTTRMVERYRDYYSRERSTVDELNPRATSA